MQNTKQILPQSFEIINGITYFRLENGKIAVEEIDNITIESSKEDIVELITVAYDSNTTKFWKTNSKLYALASSSCITIPEDIAFAGKYCSDNYPEGQYIRYRSCCNYGIIYVSETEVSYVISHEKGYKNITFQNNLFYAELKEGDKKYHVIDEAGELIEAFPSKCRKLDKYMLFYNYESIFVNSSEFKIPGGISEVEVIEQDKITFVKVVNSSGIYYYTKEIKYLFGPIQKDIIHGFNHEACFVHEVVNQKVVQIFYIKITETGEYICENLSCEKGINELGVNEVNNEYKCFLVDKTLYIFQDEKFILITNGVEGDKYVVHVVKVGFKDYSYNFVGYRKNIPVYYVNYYTQRRKIYENGILERVSDGYNSSHICKMGNRILVIDYNGKIVLNAYGNKCHKKVWFGNLIYIIENASNRIEIYRDNGQGILIE